ncbi:MAG TPA: hypothetical protein PLI68_07845 [Bacteroidia bacterium]|nr:hypothetical protein [Bacteroidia bacterium]
MSHKAYTQSNTLSNATQTSAATKTFKRVSLSPSKEKLFFKISRPSKKFLKPDHTKLTPTDITRKYILEAQSRKPAGNSVQARCFILGRQKVN